MIFNNGNEKFNISKCFTDNMVIQRDDVIRIWGKAGTEYESAEVFASFKGLFGKTKIKNGKWLITLNGTLPASSEPSTLTVTSPDGTEFSFNDILVGDLYMVIGQSNIRYPLEALTVSAPKGYHGHDMQIDESAHIRLNLSSIHDADGNDIYPTRGTTELCDDIRNDRGWKKPSEGAMEFSALGYLTAEKIIKETDNKIPIGLIEIDADGQSINDFLPNEVAEALGTDTLIDGVYKGMFHIDMQPTRFVYNHFIYPWQNMPISGIIWYQGESDFNEVNMPVFAQNYAAFMTEFRRRFNLNHEIPVYMVEIPSCYLPPNDWPAGAIWAYIDFGMVRAEMGRIPNLIPETYIAPSSDLWLDRDYWNSLHPYCKWGQSQRIADLILATKYGIYTLDNVAAPQAKQVTYDNRKVLIKYIYTGGELISATSELNGFEVKTADGIWHKAKAYFIADDTVEVIMKPQIKVEKPFDGNNHLTEEYSTEEIFGVRYCAVTDYSFPRNVNLASYTKVPAVAFVDEKDKDCNSRKKAGITSVEGADTKDIMDSAK